MHVALMIDAAVYPLDIDTYVQLDTKNRIDMKHWHNRAL